MGAGLQRKILVRLPWRQNAETEVTPCLGSPCLRSCFEDAIYARDADVQSLSNLFLSVACRDKSVNTIGFRSGRRLGSLYARCSKARSCPLPWLLRYRFVDGQAFDPV